MKPRCKWPPEECLDCGKDESVGSLCLTCLQKLDVRYEEGNRFCSRRCPLCRGRIVKKCRWNVFESLSPEEISESGKRCFFGRDDVTLTCSSEFFLKIVHDMSTASLIDFLIEHRSETRSALWRYVGSDLLSAEASRRNSDYWFLHNGMDRPFRDRLEKGLLTNHQLAAFTLVRTIGCSEMMPKIKAELKREEGPVPKIKAELQSRNLPPEDKSQETPPPLPRQETPPPLPRTRKSSRKPSYFPGWSAADAFPEGESSTAAAARRLSAKSLLPSKNAKGGTKPDRDSHGVGLLERVLECRAARGCDVVLLERSQDAVQSFWREKQQWEKRSERRKYIGHVLRSVAEDGEVSDSQKGEEKKHSVASVRKAVSDLVQEKVTSFLHVLTSDGFEHRLTFKEVEGQLWLLEPVRKGEVAAAEKREAALSQTDSATATPQGESGFAARAEGTGEQSKGIEEQSSVWSRDESGLWRRDPRFSGNTTEHNEAGSQKESGMRRTARAPGRGAGGSLNELQFNWEAQGRGRGEESGGTVRSNSSIPASPLRSREFVEEGRSQPQLPDGYLMERSDNPSNPSSACDDGANNANSAYADLLWADEIAARATNAARESAGLARSPSARGGPDS